MTQTVGFVGAGRMGGAIAGRMAADPAWDVRCGLGASDVGALWHVVGADGRTERD